MPSESQHVSRFESRWKAEWTEAVSLREKAETKARVMRSIANDHEAKEKLSKRLFDAKMRRLAAGDKLKRRKRLFGAARRTYEAIIEWNQVMHKCEWVRCRAAGAETDAAKAQIRVLELENRFLSHAS